MEILFKSDNKIFFIEDDELDWKYIYDEVLENVPLICEQPIIFHGLYDNNSFPVFYVHSNSVIYKHHNRGFYMAELNSFKKIDYTQVNINKILNGNII